MNDVINFLFFSVVVDETNLTAVSGILVEWPFEPPAAVLSLSLASSSLLHRRLVTEIDLSRRPEQEREGERVSERQRLNSF